jgi:O-antigen ligase
MIAPLLAMLVAPAPAGFGGRSTAMLLALVLLALVIAGARLSDNRMVWVALGTVFVTAFGLAAIRWRTVLRQMPLRWYAPVIVLLMILGAMFAETALDRAKAHFPPQTTLAQTFSSDPRLQLWHRTIDLISVHPWRGYGFGKSILQQELRDDLNDPTMTHAHNLFVSQWLQTGAIGFIAFVLLLVALFLRYVRFFRAADDTRALLGLIGIALLAGFVVKNVTDDFLLRSNAKEFWALNAALLGLGVRRERSQANGDALSGTA